VLRTTRTHQPGHGLSLEIAVSLGKAVLTGQQVR